MNKDTPFVPILVRKQFLNQKDGYEKGWIFGVCAPRHKALLFHVFLESGATWWRLPLHALTRKESEPISMEESQMWGNDCEEIDVIAYQFLIRKEVSIRLRSNQIQDGEYLFTVDYQTYGTLADTPNEHKCSHIIALDSGPLVSYPNNRLLWYDRSISRRDAISEGYQVTQNIYAPSEKEGQNFSEESDFFYGQKSN